jgi:hypothetical protein
MGIITNYKEEFEQLIILKESKINILKVYLYYYFIYNTLIYEIHNLNLNIPIKIYIKNYLKLILINFLFVNLQL